LPKKSPARKQSHPIPEQTRRNSDDLAALRTRTKRIEEKVDGLERKVDGLDRKLNDFVHEFPSMVRDTMREVLGERDSRS
jgi:seryl-tRNA synthetase